MQNFDHNIGFLEKRHFCRKLAKIAENCDHNIDPWSDVAFYFVRNNIGGTGTNLQK
jgi:hypothetical protein